MTQDAIAIIAEKLITDHLNSQVKKQIYHFGFSRKIIYFYIIKT